MELQKDLRQLWSVVFHISEEIEELKRRLFHLQKLVNPYIGSAEKELLQEFPNSRLNPKLMNMIGSEPYLAIEDEKKELIDIIRRKYNSEKNLH